MKPVRPMKRRAVKKTRRKKIKKILSVDEAMIADLKRMPFYADPEKQAKVVARFREKYPKSSDKEMWDAEVQRGVAIYGSTEFLFSALRSIIDLVERIASDMSRFRFERPTMHYDMGRRLRDEIVRGKLTTTASVHKKGSRYDWRA